MKSLRISSMSRIAKEDTKMMLHSVESRLVVLRYFWRTESSVIAYSMPNDAIIAISMNGFFSRPTLKIDLFWLRALYALKSWITTSVAKAIVVDLIYAIVSVLSESPSDHPYRYKFHVKTPITIAPMKRPMYVNLVANLQSMMCFFGFLS